LEEERTDALEMAEKAHEERETKTPEEVVLQVVPFAQQQCLFR
jgi:hypothetical protein